MYAPLAARSVAAKSRMSPSMNSILSAIRDRFSRWPVIRLSSTRTRSPRLTSASAICEPMNPAPPVTRYNLLSPTLIISFLEASHAAGERAPGLTFDGFSGGVRREYAFGARRRNLVPVNVNCKRGQQSRAQNQYHHSRPVGAVSISDPGPAKHRAQTVVSQRNAAVALARDDQTLIKMRAVRL